MLKKKFCPYCGSVLGRRKVEGRERPFCLPCEVPIYENPVPASALVVADEAGRLLLVKRAVEPKAGQWCLPGGFMELGETPEECALRALSEEPGLTGSIEELLGVTTNQSQDYHTVLIMGFLVRDFSG
ncbi:MAG: NUDIX domain-containing protein, partial [Deltaproteobacteria bacterium]|nr:NUDIX domain-containing protein [Deltaproteobacteria bacterium]